MLFSNKLFLFIVFSLFFTASSDVFSSDNVPWNNIQKKVAGVDISAVDLTSMKRPKFHYNNLIKWIDENGKRAEIEKFAGTKIENVYSRGNYPILLSILSKYKVHLQQEKEKKLQAEAFEKGKQEGVATGGSAPAGPPVNIPNVEDTAEGLKEMSEFVVNLFSPGGDYENENKLNEFKIIEKYTELVGKTDPGAAIKILVNFIKSNVKDNESTEIARLKAENARLKKLLLEREGMNEQSSRLGFTRMDATFDSIFIHDDNLVVGTKGADEFLKAAKDIIDLLDKFDQLYEKNLTVIREKKILTVSYTKDQYSAYWQLTLII